MALIREYGGECPCPVCLIKEWQLSDLTVQAPLQDCILVQDLHEEVYSLPRVQQEAAFKDQGLRQIEVSIYWQPWI